MQAQYIFDPRVGIILYKNAVPNPGGIIEELEETIGSSTTDYYKWSSATVGNLETVNGYRECFDCKINASLANNAPDSFSGIKSVYRKTTDPLRECLYDYEARFNIKMDFMESVNYVKYGAGNFFKPHADHGFSYTATVSSVMYLNDNYEGGELYFPTFNFKIKPKAGDVIMFPSTFIYNHGSDVVTSGVKYSAVTMFDYNERNHKGFQYGFNLDGSPADPEAGRGVRFPNGRLLSQLIPLEQDYEFSRYS
jgi:hypothetical protein